MKILCLTKYDSLGASSRVRSMQYIPYLAAQGIEVTVSPLLGNDYIQKIYHREKISFWYLLKRYVARFKLLLKAKSYDLVWVEKEVFIYLPFIFEKWFLKRVNYIIDYDDAVFHNYDLHRNVWVRRFLGKKIAKVMAQANHVMVGNQYLADYAKRAGARDVTLIPTVVDMTKYMPAQNIVVHHKIIVGWIGTPKTVHYLKDIAVVLQKLSARFPIVLYIMGVSHYQIAGVEVHCVPWAEDKEVAFVQSIDIGVMPLIDCAFERGKCGYKLIQYMAVGKPVVASPIGVNVEIVEPEVNGYLAEDQAAWMRAFETLCQDSNLRLGMGRRGHQKIVAHYSLQAIAPRLVTIMQSIRKSV